MLLILLLRSETVSILKQFISMDEGMLLGLEQLEHPIETAQDLLEVALDWFKHPEPKWRLCAKPKGNELQALTSSTDISAIADACEWCLMPWGADYPGLMVALISSDRHLIDRTMDALRRIDDDLLVAHYTATDVFERQFNGVVFSSSSDSSCESLWLTNDSPTILALTIRGGDAAHGCSGGVELIAEEAANDPDTGMRVTRRWLRMLTVDAMRHYAHYEYTSFFVGGIRQRDLEGLFARSKVVGRDGLRLGLRALRSSHWIYLPKMESSREQIFIHRNPQVTAKLLVHVRASSSECVVRGFC